MAKTDLEIMSLMAKNNQDISASTTITKTNLVKRGGEVTFGVTPEILHRVNKAVLGIPDVYVVAYFINKEQFDALKNE